MSNTVLTYITHCTRNIIPGILFVAMVATGCKNDPKEINALVNKTNTQEDKAYDVTIYYSEVGEPKVTLYAKEFIRNEVAKPPFVDVKKGLKVEFLDDSLRVKTTLTAKYARLYEKEQNVLIRDSIVIVNNKGEQLNTEELVWNQKIRKYYTEKFVKIRTATQIIYGDGLEANEDFSEYEIKHPKGIVQVDKTDVP